MMKQYWQIKSQHPDKLILFRLGDFFELFYDDAIIASRELELTLTARENKHQRVPMCGVPCHAVESYLVKLVSRGYKVAICEQVEDPRLSKGLVRREVVRVVTPGTLTEGALLDGRENHYLTAVAGDADTWAVASTDLLTGELIVTGFSGPEAISHLASELQRLSPAECLVAESAAELINNRLLGPNAGTTFTTLHQDEFDQVRTRDRVVAQFGIGTADNLEAAGSPVSVQAVGALLSYVASTQLKSLSHLKPPRYYGVEEFLILDATARRHLALTSKATGGIATKTDTLFGVLDQTQTAMGARRLQQWIQQPLVDKQRIEARLNSVEALVNHTHIREQVRQKLRKVYDLERLAGRIALGNANARELAALRNSLKVLPEIKELCQAVATGFLNDTLQRLDPLTDIFHLLNDSLVDSPPVSLTEGGLFRPGYNAEVDRLREAARNGKQWLTNFEQEERERTGIKSLKIGYNKVFGYYLEVTNANKHLVPANYERKQTLVNAERYITPELKKMEAEILGAEERLIDLEYQLFLELRRRIGEQVERLQTTAAAVAELDVITSLATVAANNGYTRPAIHDDLRLKIEDGCHPILAAQPDVNFVPNDTDLHGDHRPMAIVTGPNMGGKSTYLRQVALIVIMAQMGCFVPARRAEIGIVDRIFTRIGASDELSRGRSTFRVEIDEALQVLLFGTRRSLAVIDELGRGTSTFDGIAFSTAYLEYLYEHIHCRTLVSTHFFELTSLADRLEGVQNLHAVAKLDGEKLIFSYRIEPGAVDRSYGIEVAQSVGMPAAVIRRARELLSKLEAPRGLPAAGSKLPNQAQVADNKQNGKLNTPMVDSEIRRFIREIARVDILNMTPLKAMMRLQELSEAAQRLETQYFHD